MMLVIGSVGATAMAYRAADSLRGTPVEIVMDGEGHAPLRTSELDFDERIGLLSGADLEPGHRVEALTDVEVLDRLVADLESARVSITFLAYYCEPGVLGSRVTDALAERARAGVNVLFLGDDFGCGALLDEVQGKLRSAGVHFARFRPVRWYSLGGRAKHRMHARIVVIDGRLGYTGGFGLSDKWLEDPEARLPWRDTSVRFSGPAVAQMQSAFLAVWAEATGQLLTGEAFLPMKEAVTARGPIAQADGSPDGALSGGEPTLQTAPSPYDPPPNDSAAAAQVAEGGGVGGVVAGFLHSHPGPGPTGGERFLTATLAAAERTLFIANSYFVPTPPLRRLLVQAARRGVDVRILLPGKVMDIPSAAYAGQGFYDELLSAGVRIYEFDPTMMHAKTIVADGVWSAVGTINLDNRSIRMNDEASLLVHDATFGARMEALFLADVSRAREVTLAEHRRRPWHHRVREWLATKGALLL
jgi:cardiolipin synthase A/B